MVQPLAGLFKYVRKLNGYVSGRFREPLQQLSRLTALIGGKAVFGDRVGIVGKFLQLRFIGQERVEEQQPEKFHIDRRNPAFFKRVEVRNAQLQPVDFRRIVRCGPGETQPDRSVQFVFRGDQSRFQAAVHALPVSPD